MCRCILPCKADFLLVFNFKEEMSFSFTALSGDCGLILRASLPRTSTLSFQFIPNNPKSRETIQDAKTA